VEQGYGPPEETVVTFEDALACLEAVVANLEQGEMTLAESLEAFREGIKNLSICVGHLDAFESQVCAVVGVLRLCSLLAGRRRPRW
jgi:exodeoxyribonuclease VII small subunit